MASPLWLSPDRGHVGTAGWSANVKRVERIWRQEGLKVLARQPKRGWLWLNNGSCIRLRAEHPNHVSSYDFVGDRTYNGLKSRMLNVIDEFTRECIAIRIDRKLNSTDVIDVQAKVAVAKRMIARTWERFGHYPSRLATDAGNC